MVLTSFVRNLSQVSGCASVTFLNSGWHYLTIGFMRRNFLKPSGVAPCKEETVRLHITKRLQKRGHLWVFEFRGLLVTFVPGGRKLQSKPPSSQALERYMQALPSVRFLLTAEASPDF